MKSRKLKLFCLLLLLIILLNCVILMKFSPLEKYKMMKEKIKSVVQKLNKISPHFQTNNIKNDNSQKENFAENSLVQNITEKKNN